MFCPPACRPHYQDSHRTSVDHSPDVYLPSPLLLDRVCLSVLLLCAVLLATLGSWIISSPGPSLFCTILIGEHIFGRTLGSRVISSHGPSLLCTILIGEKHPLEGPPGGPVYVPILSFLIPPWRPSCNIPCFGTVPSDISPPLRLPPQGHWFLGGLWVPGLFLSRPNFLPESWPLSSVFLHHPLLHRVPSIFRSILIGKW